MQKIIFYIIYPILWFLSILPFPIFYLISDIIYVIVYHLLGYRKKVVRENIQLTLPHLSKKEQLNVEKKFYRHMCDMFLEMIKSMSVSENELRKRFTFTNIEVYKEYEQKNKSIVLFYAHYASWEWSIILCTYAKFKGFGIYKRIKNPYFDNLVKDIRSRFDGTLIDTKSTIQKITENQNNGILGTYGFISDQTPSKQKAFYWNDFMGYNVPIHTGGEMLARKLDMNILYMKVRKVKRGYYEATFVPIAENINDLPEYEASRLFMKEVEKQIYEAPEYYFWTHKRWKFRNQKA